MIACPCDDGNDLVEKKIDHAQDKGKQSFQDKRA